MDTYSSDFTQETYLGRDFAHLIEHRVRKDWRINDVFDKRKKYALVDDGKLTTNLLKHFLDKIFLGHFSLTLIKSEKDTSLDGFDTILISSDCLDIYLARRLDVFLDKKSFDVFSELVPLRSITKKECEQLANLWKITGTPIPDEHEMIKNLHEKYDQTKQSMLKSFLQLEEIENSE